MIGNNTRIGGIALLCLICGFLCSRGSAVYAGGPIVDDTQAKAFFDLVNLDYPGLETVKSSVQTADYHQAKEALVAYYRARKHPGWYPATAGNPRDIEAANNVLERKMLALTHTEQLQKKIDWAANPVGDREWAWSLNRNYAFGFLASAYHQTRDEKYAADFNDILTDWILSNPVPMVSSNHSSSWRTIEAGIRMFNSWPAAWFAFKDSPSFTTDARILMLRSMTEHADYLVKFPTGGNWNLMESNGLLHVGALFPEFKGAGNWKDTAIKRLIHQMHVQVYPDGAQFELSTAYHTVSLSNLMEPVMLRRLADGIAFPREYYDGLVRMQKFNAGVMRPDGNAPAINDADASPFFQRVRDQIERLGRGDTSELKPVMDVQPEKKSVFFPYSGLFCMRTGDQPQDLYLMMDAGPFGAGHQHEDKLNLEVYAYGRPLISDPGRYSYTAAGAPHRGPGGHSLIQVDGMGQDRRKSDRALWIVRHPAPGNRWVSRDNVDYAEGTYNDGFGPENDKTITHIRKVFFVKGEYWIVCDLLKGKGEHEFEQLWHFTPCTVETSKGQVRTSLLDAANLAVVRSDGAEVRIVEGQDLPILGYYAPSYNVRKASPTAVFTSRAKAPVAYETVLYPSPRGKTVAPKVEPLTCLLNGKPPRQGQLSAISIELPGYRDLCVICHTPKAGAGKKTFLDFEFTGEAVWIRTDGQGNIVKQITLGDARVRRTHL